MVIRLLQARKIEGTGNEVSRDRVGSGRALYGVKRTTVVLGRMILIPSSMGQPWDANNDYNIRKGLLTCFQGAVVRHGSQPW